MESEGVVIMRIHMQLQYFGGRGSSGGNSKASAVSAAAAYREAIGKTKFGAEAIERGEAVRFVKSVAEKIAATGTYEYEGENYDIEYKRGRTGRGDSTLDQYVDGKAYGGRVEIHRNDDGSTTYVARNADDETKSTKSINVATKFAFKLDRGWKKKK